MKAALDSRETYHEFLKLVNLFVQDLTRACLVRGRELIVNNESRYEGRTCDRWWVRFDGPMVDGRQSDSRTVGHQRWKSKPPQQKPSIPSLLTNFQQLMFVGWDVAVGDAVMQDSEGESRFTNAVFALSLHSFAKCFLSRNECQRMAWNFSFCSSSDCLLYTQDSTQQFRMRRTSSPHSGTTSNKIGR